METQKDRGQEYLTTYYKHYRRAHGVKYCMGSHLGSASMGSAWDHHPGLKRNEFDSSLGGQIFRGVEPPRTGGGNIKIDAKRSQYNTVLK